MLIVARSELLRVNKPEPLTNLGCNLHHYSWEFALSPSTSLERIPFLAFLLRAWGWEGEEFNKSPGSPDVMLSILLLFPLVRHCLSCTIWNVKHLLCKCVDISIITGSFMEINSASSDLHVS